MLLDSFESGAELYPVSVMHMYVSVYVSTFSGSSEETLDYS